MLRKRWTMFRLFMVVVLVGLVVVAFYRGWVQVSLDNNSERAETSAILTFHKDKFVDDVTFVKNEARDIPEKIKDKADTKVQGKVDAVAPGKLTVSTSEGRQLTFAIARETNIRVGQKQATLADLQAGDAVTVGYVTLEDGQVAMSVRKDG